MNYNPGCWFLKVCPSRSLMAVRVLKTTAAEKLAILGLEEQHY